MVQNYYTILGINKESDEGQIKKAYKKLALQYHPDKNVNNKDYNPELYREVSNAYQILIDPVKKKKYDTIMEINGMNNLSDEEFIKIFGNFYSPSDIFSHVFYDIVPQKYHNITNNLIDYFFEDKDELESYVNNFKFDKIFKKVKEGLFIVPKQIFRDENMYREIFYKILNIVFYIFYFCSFHFLYKMTKLES
jgi:DnaJ-class molecular chaperone